MLARVHYGRPRAARWANLNRKAQQRRIVEAAEVESRRYPN